MLTILGTAALGWIAAGTLVIGLCFRNRLAALWREPVLRYPILILESDDWGPGPDRHAEALHALAAILRRFRDSRGCHPVMTLGMILALPDTARMQEEGMQRHHRITLADHRFQSILAAIDEGVRWGVFSLQLHGMEHYWPPALMAAAKSDADVRGWLAQDLPDTENLPPHLQSRWTDAAALPSREIAEGAIETAVAEEVAAFAEIFGESPSVAVPPTFVWNDAVERGWAIVGVRCIVTPGARYRARDQQGKLVPDRTNILNGEQGQNGIAYAVRNDYFEPALGHKAHDALAAVARKTALGRPTLLEMHRFNFTAPPDLARRSHEELQSTLMAVLHHFPSVRFMSTGELARHFSGPATELLEIRPRARIQAWIGRLRGIPRFRKLAMVSGAAVPLWILSVITRSAQGVTRT